MIKRFLMAMLFLIFLLSSYDEPLAIYDPLSVPNNKFGIHIFNEKDLQDAQKLVNANGDWGYLTFVITEGERDHDRWQKVFDQMRRLHLIPIVRVATKAQGDTWEKPKLEEINNWIAFLNSLNWVIKNRYVIIGNEPNLDREWGGKSNPAEYASYLTEFSEKLKAASNDFFVLPAGLAPDKNEFKFLDAMQRSDPNIFNQIDGWTSHSYPSKSTTLFAEELARIRKTLPVFITETGWPEGEFSEGEITKNIASAYQNDWNKSDVVAVTPFILNYPQSPFTGFSWKDANGNFRKWYFEIQNMAKTQGEPIQIEKGKILAAFAQPLTIPGGNFVGAVLARNTGQSIWNITNAMLLSEGGNISLKSFLFNEVEPYRLGLVLFKAQAPESTGVFGSSLFLRSVNGAKLTNSFPIKVFVVAFDKLHFNLGFLGSK